MSQPFLSQRQVAVQNRYVKRLYDADQYNNDLTERHGLVRDQLSTKLAEVAASDGTYNPIRPHAWQAAVMADLLDGSDVVLKAGTGSGKSLVFHAMPLFEPDKVVLVVSPLNSLMQDQVDRACAIGVRATSLNVG